MQFAPIFLLAFVIILYYATTRVKAGHVPALRRIEAFEALKGFTSRAVETGRNLHLSLGLGGVANQTTADSLAGLAVLQHLARRAAATGIPPLVTMANPLLLLFAQNVLRSAHLNDPEGAEEAYRRTRWIAPQPAAYAAGVMNILNQDDVEANVMVGTFGDEYLLMGETAARQRLAHMGGTSDPNTLPFIYASAGSDRTLFGEEIYAAGAYLDKRPFHLGSLVAQDIIRWIIALLILGSALAATLGVGSPQ
jgi:hypothetical protein